MGSTKKSLKVRGGSLCPRSDLGVALPSTATDNESSTDNELALKIVCIVLERLMYETLSGDKLYLAFSSAKTEIDKMNDKRASELFTKLVLLADDRRKRNPLFKAFGI